LLATFDITITDEHGDEAVAIESFTMRRISGGAALTSLRRTESPIAEPAGLESTVGSAMREGILPSESSGYYHEYTVITPGSPDRGARRLVGGGAKTTPEHVYYTADHYSSFCEVDENS